MILLVGAALAQDAWLCVGYTPGPERDALGNRVIHAETTVHVNGKKAAELHDGEGICLRAEEGNYQLFYRGTITMPVYDPMGSSQVTSTYELSFRQELRAGQAVYQDTGRFKSDHLDERDGFQRHEGMIYVQDRDKAWWTGMEVQAPDRERVGETVFTLPALPPRPDPTKAEREAIDPDQFSLEVE